MTEARLGLVGLGRWGRRLADTVARTPGARLAAVATSRPPGAPLPPGCRLVDSWHDLLDDDGVDAIVLAVPPTLHRALAVACLESGRPVLVEKPLATTVGDALAVAATSAARGVPVMVDHTHLWSSAFVRLSELTGSRPLRIDSAGGGHGPFGRAVDPLWDWGPHDIAMCLALAGAAPTAVEAERREDPVSGGSVTDLELHFAHGDVCRLRVGNAMREKRRWLRVQDADGTVLVYDDLAVAKLTRDDGAGPVAVDLDPSLPLDRVIAQFAALVVAGTPHHPSVDLGTEVVRTLAATGIPA